MSFLVEDLINSAKFRTMMPISQSTFQDSDLITMADEELLLKLVRDIQSVREDFFLKTKSVTLVSGVNHYSIPKRAIGNSFEFLHYVDSGNNEKLLQRIPPERRHEYAGQTGTPDKFYIQGDEVVICPTPSSSIAGSIRFTYGAKPNRLIATTSCAKITGISSSLGTTTFTVNTDLTASLSVGSKIDILSSSSPYLLWSDEVLITAITSTTIAVATSAVSDEASSIEPQVNDYICPSGQSNIPMVPEEFHPVLAQMLSVRLLAALGDINKWNAAKAELQEVRKEAISLIKNRVEATPERVAGRNGLTKIFGRY